MSPFEAWPNLGDNPSSLASGLGAWSGRAGPRLELVSFPFTPTQREIVERAIARALPSVHETEEPNRRALALVEVCREWPQSRVAQPFVLIKATPPRNEGDPR